MVGVEVADGGGIIVRVIEPPDGGVGNALRIFCGVCNGGVVVIVGV